MALREHTQYIVIHSSATKPSQDVDAEWCDRLHKSFGWSGIGYAYFIVRDGEIQEGRPRDQVGAHVKGYNDRSIGVCLAGGLNEETGKAEDNYTDAQMWSLYNLVYNSLHPQYPNAEILGHRDLSPDIDGDGVVEPHEWLKQCPCFDVRKWWREVNLNPPNPVGFPS